MNTKTSTTINISTVEWTTFCWNGLLTSRKRTLFINETIQRFILACKRKKTRLLKKKNSQLFFFSLFLVSSDSSVKHSTVWISSRTVFRSNHSIYGLSFWKITLFDFWFLFFFFFFFAKTFKHKKCEYNIQKHSNIKNVNISDREERKKNGILQYNLSVIKNWLKTRPMVADDSVKNTVLLVDFGVDGYELNIGCFMFEN